MPLTIVCLYASVESDTTSIPLTKTVVSSSDKKT